MTSSTLASTARLLAIGLTVSLGAGGALVAAGAGPASAGSATSQYGTLGVADGTLPAADRCAVYALDYALTPPPGDWALETSIVDPRGNTVASGAILSDYSPGGATSSIPFTLCSNNVVAGTFTVLGKISTDDGTGRVTNAQMAPASFTMGSPPTAVKKKSPCQKKKYKKRHQRQCAKKR